MNLGDDDLRLLCVIEGETEVFPIDIEGRSWRNPGRPEEEDPKGTKKWSISWRWCPQPSTLEGACYRRFAMSDNMAYFPVLLAQRYQSHQCKPGRPCVYSQR